jgi:hypothetical protein
MTGLHGGKQKLHISLFSVTLVVLSILIDRPSKNIIYSNMTSFFRFVNKRASYPFGIISLAHAPVIVTDFSIGSIYCVRHFPQT